MNGVDGRALLAFVIMVVLMRLLGLRPPPMMNR